MQLQVIKADGTIEQYLHTKVIAAFSYALSNDNDPDTFATSQLAESVTFYLYNNYHGPNITSGEIFSIIIAALTSTNYCHAADSLSRNHHRRNLLRSRIEVTDINAETLVDAEKLKTLRQNNNTGRWNKSHIIGYLKKRFSLENDSARTIASMVEQKIINSNLQCIPTGFIKHLVLTQTNAILSAEESLKTVSANSIEIVDMDVRFRQQQEGFCTVEI